MKRSTKMVTIAILISQALVLHLIEGAIPNPLMAIVPWARLGLANIVTLATLSIFGFKEALVVVVIRTSMGALLGGNITASFLAISGGLLSAVAMGIAFKFKKYFSLMGVSVIGAAAHNIGQLFAASIIIENFLIYANLPFMLVAAVLTGYFIGITTQYLIRLLEKNPKLKF